MVLDDRDNNFFILIIHQEPKQLALCTSENAISMTILKMFIKKNAFTKQIVILYPLYKSRVPSK
jgi:hypothetical protein